MNKSTRRFSNIILPLLFVVVTQGLQYRWDTTQDQRYTLNEKTKVLLSSIEKPLKIDVFLTGKLPANYLRLKREITTLIKSMEQHTDQLIFSYVDPFESGDSTDVLVGEMTQFGMTPDYITAMENQALEQTVIFPWAMVNYGNRSIRIPLLKKVLGDDEQQKINRSIAQLEFHFFEALFQITQKQKSKLAVLTSHGTSEALKIADLVRSIQGYYQLASFDLKALENDPNKTLENLKRFSLLIISNPSEPFNESEKYILDQHLLNGGKQLWAINAVAVNRDSLFNSNGSAVAIGRSLNMESAFFKYGFRLKKNLIKDLYCAPIVLASGRGQQTQYLPYPWPYHLLVKPSDKQLFGLNSGNVLMPFSSTIDTLKNTLEKTIIISSSEFSKIQDIPVNVELIEATEKLNPDEFNQESQTTGVLIKGKFSSAYENRVKPFKLDKEKISGESEMIIFSSGVIAENQLDKGNPLELGYDKWTNNFYYNKEFIKQSIHYLMENQCLLSIQNKSLVISHLDIEKVKNMSGILKTSLLMIPILILILMGVVVYYWGKHRFGQ